MPESTTASAAAASFYGCGDKSDVDKNSNNNMGDKVIKVQCGANEAPFHVSRYTSGGRSKCVFFGRKWVSPVEFEEQGWMR